MPRFLPWVALCACCAFLPLVAPACSSSDDDDGVSGGADSGTPDEGVLSDDEGVIGVPEAEVPQFDAFVPGSCHTSGNCVTGEVCGFPSDGTGGCTAQGSCVYPAPPTDDAGVVLVGCSCNGQNVPYVTASLTSLPVMSPIACVDAGPTSGSDGGDAGDAGDASLDGSPDAGNDAGDAADD